MFDIIALGSVFLSLKIDSIWANSVAVVSSPAKAHQSFTTKPPPITSLPLFTVPAISGTCGKDAEKALRREHALWKNRCVRS